MKCINDELIQKYIDGETSAEEEFEIYNHISECKECRKKTEFARKKATHIKTILCSVSENPDTIPPFNIPQLKKQTASSRWKKWAFLASAACITMLFVVHTQKPKIEIERIYTFDVTGEYNANLPITEQEMTIQIIETDGKIIHN